MAKIVVYAAALIWLACVGVSILALNAPPQGDSFLRGFNRIEGFLTWQLAALGAAVAGAVALRAVRPAAAAPNSAGRLRPHHSERASRRRHRRHRCLGRFLAAPAGLPPA